MAFQEETFDRRTLMAREVNDAPRAIERQLGGNSVALRRLADRLRHEQPPVVITCASGSYDHAATYGKHLIESLLGIPVAPMAPSVVSLCNSPMHVRGALLLAISQSGRGEELLAITQSYRAAGAHVVALVDNVESPLADMADNVLPLYAGSEPVVPTTKSCIAAMSGLAALVAAWSGDRAMAAPLQALPQTCEQALQLDWSAIIDAFCTAGQMFVLGNGYSFGIAQEAARKLKETCAIQAEPFSSADVRHGPMRVIYPGFPILAFATSDKTGADVISTAREFADSGANALIAGPGGALPIVPTHPALEPIPMLASFYVAVERLSLLLGMNRGSPPGLAKVTRTQ